MYDEHERGRDHEPDRCEILVKVERTLLERGVDGVGGARQQERVSVGRRRREGLRRDRSAGAGTRLDHDLLPQHVGDFRANSRATMSGPGPTTRG